MPHAKDENGDKKAKKKKKDKKKDETQQPANTKLKKPKKAKKSIYISYSPDSSFNEKKFVVELVQQIKENNLGEDIWFDKDEGIVNDPSWLTLRLEAVDRCRAAIILISRDYMTCPVSVYESKIILERITTDEVAKQPRVFCVLLEPISLTRSFTETLMSAQAEVVDLTEFSSLSTAEKSSFAVGALIERLEQVASMKTPYVRPIVPPSDGEFTGAYQSKHVVHWTQYDVNEWLYSIGIREFYRQSFSEQAVDGYLLLASSDSELQWSLGIDSKIIRKKITSQLFQVLEKEQKIDDNWHLRARVTRPKQDHVYIIYDPQDVRLATNLNSDIGRRGFKVITHGKLGQSRSEFLKLNGGLLAQCNHVICILTESAAASPFVFHEVLFSSWLGGGRTIATAAFKNVWDKLKNPLKAALGDSPSIDFETKMYSESLDVLEHLIKPPDKIAGIVLEQTYIDRMNDGIQPLRALCAQNANLRAHTMSPFEEETLHAKVFISYQWDMQAKVLHIADHFLAHDMPCWADLTMSTRPSLSRMSVRTTSSSASYADLMQSETLKTHIQRNMKEASLVLCCITPQYANCANCEQDLALAMSLQKPILPVMLRWVSWPPEGISERVRRIMVRLPRPVDMSNEKLYKANLGLLTERVSQIVNSSFRTPR
ncbi:uncharacterized protein LOC120334601 [Styela clava]